MKRIAKMWCFRLLVLAVVLVFLPSCVKINIVDRTPATPLLSTELDSAVNADEHDLTVLAIDFDPPLEYEQLVTSREGITLLVAVENSGGSSENDVTVQAELSTDDGQKVILTNENLIPAIAPGEIKIVRFKSLGDIPYRTAYRLKVWVVPVAGEASIANNQKSYDLYVTQPE